MDSEKRSRVDRMEASVRELVAASETLYRRTGGWPEDAQAINRLIIAVHRQAHAIVTVTPLSGVEASVRDAVAGQIYRDPDDPRPCFRCGGSGIDPWFSQPATGPSYNSMGEPPVLEPCVACQWGDPHQESGSDYPARAYGSFVIHAAQPWPDDPTAGYPLTACKSSVFQSSWYRDKEMAITCGPCRQVIGQDGGS